MYTLFTELFSLATEKTKGRGPFRCPEGNLEFVWLTMLSSHQRVSSLLGIWIRRRASSACNYFHACYLIQKSAHNYLPIPPRTDTTFLEFDYSTIILIICNKPYLFIAPVRVNYCKFHSTSKLVHSAPSLRKCGFLGSSATKWWLWMHKRRYCIVMGVGLGYIAFETPHGGLGREQGVRVPK